MIYAYLLNIIYCYCASVYSFDIWSVSYNSVSVSFYRVKVHSLLYNFELLVLVVFSGFRTEMEKFPNVFKDEITELMKNVSCS